MKHKKKFFALFFSILLFCLAGNAGAFSISPTKTLATITPGESQTIILKIKNEEGYRTTYKISVLGFKQNNKGEPEIGPNIDIAEKWLKAKTNKISIGPNKTALVAVLVQVPKNTSAGAHYVAIAAKPVSGNQENASSLSGQVVSLIFIQVAGLVNESLAIAKWEATQDWSQNLPWQFNLRLINNGDIEMPLSGAIKINNWRGQNISEEKTYLGNLLLAGSLRNLTLTPKLNSNNIYLPGLYQAQIKITYGKTGQTALATARIWYLPKWSILSIVSATLIIIAMLFFANRFLKKLIMKNE